MTDQFQVFECLYGKGPGDYDGFRPSLNYWPIRRRAGNLWIASSICDIVADNPESVVVEHWYCSHVTSYSPAIPWEGDWQVGEGQYRIFKNLSVPLRTTGTLVEPLLARLKDCWEARRATDCSRHVVLRVTAKAATAELARTAYWDRIEQTANSLIQDQFRVVADATAAARRLMGYRQAVVEKIGHLG